MELERFLDRLYRSGLLGAIAVFTVPKRKEFIQFRKVFKDNGTISIELGFPNAPWSRALYPRVKEILEEGGWPYFVSKTNEDEVTEFTHVDFGGDIKNAGDCSRRLLQAVFGLRPDDTVTALLQNISPRDELISTPPRSHR